jgi:hypothetical protein
LAVDLRKRNLWIYDIRRELTAAGHSISINTLTLLLREEGFSRLSRRAADELPPTVKPEIEVADVRRLDLMELGHEEPTVLLTNHRQLGAVELPTAMRNVCSSKTESPKPSSSSTSTPVVEDRDESGFRHAVDAHGQFAISHDGSAHRQGVPPLAGQDGLSPSPKCNG